MGKSSPNYSDIGIFSDKKENARYWDDIEEIIAEAIQKVADKSSMPINKEKLEEICNRYNLRNKRDYNRKS